jgi:hypothetical protein
MMCRSFNNNSWSSSDDEGNLVGYFSDGNRIAFCESRRMGKLVGEMQMVSYDMMQTTVA